MRKILNNFVNLLASEYIDYLVCDENLNILDKLISKQSPLNDYLAKNKIQILLNKIDFDLNKKGFIGTFENLNVFRTPYEKRILIIDNSKICENSIDYLFMLNQIIMNIDEAVVIARKDNTIKFVNEIFEKKFGFKNSDIINSFFTEYLLPDYLEKVLTGIKNDILNEFDVEIYNDKGNSVLVIMQAISYKDNYLLIIHDKSEKESFDKEINDLKKMQKLIFDSIAQGILVLDKELNIIQFNKFMMSRYKFSNETVGGKNIFEVVPDLKEKGFDRLALDIIENKKVRRSFNIRRYSRRLKKELIQNLVGYPLIENNKIVGIVVLIEDITEKKMLESEFESAQKKSLIINELNSILSRSIEIEDVLEGISGYLMDFFNSDRIITHNILNKNFYEFKKIKGVIKSKILTNEYVDKYIKKYDKYIHSISIIKHKTEIKKISDRNVYNEIITIPVIYQKKHIGFFIIYLRQQISDNRVIIETLEDFQNHLGYIIDKSVLYEEKKYNLHKLEFILKISKLLSQNRDFTNLFEKLINAIMDEVSADGGVFIAKDSFGDFLPVSFVGNVKTLKTKWKYQKCGIFDYIKENKEAIIVDDIRNAKFNCVIKRRKMSVIGFPLIYRNELMGMIIINREKKVFSREEFEMLKIITTSSSSYVKNVLLQKQMEEQIDQLSVLYKISTAVRSVINYSFLKKVIISTLCTLLKADFSIFYEKDGKVLIPKEVFYNNINDRKTYLNEENISEKYFNFAGENSVYHIGNPKNKLRKIIKKQIKKVTILSIVLSKDKKYYILLGYKEKMPNNITNATLNAIIHELAIKIENAILFDESEMKLKQFNSISEITKQIAISQIGDLNEYFNFIVNSARDIANASYATILLKDGENLYFKAAAGIDIRKIKNKRIKMGEGVAGHVAKTGKTEILNDLNKRTHFKILEDLTSVYEVKNLINVPLVYKNRVIGVLCVDNKREGKFTENDANFIEALAYSTILAIERFINLEIGDKFSDIILDNIPSGVIYISHSGIIKHVNTGFSKISGYNFENIFNKKYDNIFDDRKGLIFKSLNAKKRIYREEINLIKNDGEKIPCGISISPIKKSQNTDIVCIIQDLSHIKKIQRELKEKENLALLGEMAAGMAHEIKNPLAGILTGMEFLYMQLRDTDNLYKESMELIMREVKRLDRIVNDMTSFAKSKIKIFSYVSIDKLIKRTIELTKGKYNPEKIKIEIKIPKKIPLIYIDEEQILEVLINILINATQALKEKGKIKITVNFRMKHCYIKIFNNGPTIPDDIMGKIFSPFFTTKSGGTGLGLAISYNIIKEHKGQLKVKNEKNGVLFEIILPIGEKNG